VETRNFRFSFQTIANMHALLKQHGVHALVNPMALNYLQQIVDFAQAKHIKLHVYVSPQHPLYWQFIKIYGLDAYIDLWLRELVKITPFWDFSNEIDFSPTVNNYFSTDSLHFNEEGG